MIPTWKENPMFNVLIGLVLFTLFIFLGEKSYQTMLAANQIGQPVPAEHTVTFDGVGKTTMTPDIAVMTFGILSTDTTVASAQKQNTDKMNTLMSKMKGAGIANADLQTVDYSAYEKTVWNQVKQISESQGWIVSQSLQVKIRDVQKVSDIVQIAGQSNVTNINGPTFTVDVPSKYESEARTKALADARQKAQTLAQALGLKIDQVVGYSESKNNPNPPVPYMMDAKTAVGGGPSAAPEISVGTQDLILNVSVTYLLSK